MRSVSIVDYGMSNLLSIRRAFEHLGAEVHIVHKPEEIDKADYLVLPGVGAFPDGMFELKSRGLDVSLREFAHTGKPFLGICLGMQMLLTLGHEHQITEGLGIIKGEVLPLPKDMPHFKVPNINWHQVNKPTHADWEKSLMKGTPDGTCFYFVHSYYARPENEEDTLVYSHFGDLKFAAGVRWNNVSGTQFHPEKSGESGLLLLKNFLGL